jgi:molybdopterin/thiamine biosynthesis adenylyltransferase
MSRGTEESGGIEGARILLVGAGGIGAPAAIALGAAGARRLTVIDDDRVELSNLHRQILFGDADVGRPKLEAFADRLGRRFPALAIETIAGRALPGSVLALVSAASIVIDATDNFPSRFLLADACALAGVPVVHAAAVRWHATVLAVSAGGRPCYRCLFEDLPQGDAPDCATAGVAGPVCGVAGAIAADAALRLLGGDGRVLGRIVTYDGRRDRLRAVPVAARPGCPLCGARPAITSLDASTYAAGDAACRSAAFPLPAAPFRPTSP